MRGARRDLEGANAGLSDAEIAASVDSAITWAYIFQMTGGAVGMWLFTRIAIVADTIEPTPPCGACRQLLWEFAGDLEIILGNLTGESGRHQLKDLLPLPFDRRLLK